MIGLATVHRTRRWFGAGLFALLGLGFMWSVGVDAYRNESLRHGAREADASVVDSRHPDQLRYRFDVGAEPRTYHYTGRRLFTPAWAQVPELAFAEAEATGQLRILYLPSNPHVIQPAVLRLRHPWESLGPWLLAVLMFFLASRLAFKR